MYKIYYVDKRVPQLVTGSEQKGTYRGHLFPHFSVKATFRGWQVTIKATKAQEACIYDSEEFNQG